MGNNQHASGSIASSFTALFLGTILTTVVPSEANIISNGDFADGDLSPWVCSQANCDVGEGFLAITERSKEWSGPAQLLPLEAFTSAEDLTITFNFSIRSPEVVTAHWKIKKKKGDQENWTTIHSTTVETNGEWKDIFSSVTLPTSIIWADEALLYLGLIPADADYDLDNVSMEHQEWGDWEEEANNRIENLRKRHVAISFDLDSINPTELQLEINQKNHKFPFGTAVESPRIADCYDSNKDDLYCGFVRDNFNWLVDTFR